MSTKFNMSRDVNGYNGFGLPFALDGQAVVLTAGAAETFTVPSNYPCWIAIFSYTPGSSVWVDGINTAATPSGTVAATTARLNPVACEVRAGQLISVITDDTSLPEVQVSYYYKDEYIN